MAWEYSEKTKQLFLDAVHGRPGTHMGEIEEPDGFGEHGSIVCGDALRFTFRVERHPTDPKQDVITAARYLTFGCTSAIAASEALCSLIEEGRYTPIAALKVQNRDIVDYLDGLPEQKIHCSVMGAEALEAAVFNWAQRRGVDLQALGVDIHTDEQEEGRIVCQCFSLSEPYLRRKIRELNLTSIADITNAVKAGGACMSCHHVPGGLQDLLNEVWGKDYRPLKVLPAAALAAETPTQQAPVLSPYQFSKQVEAAVDKYIRPMLQADGGDFELVDIKDALIYCKLAGACEGCPGAGRTLKMMVEKTLKEMVDERIRVIAVQRPMESSPMNIVYADNNATTPVAPEVYEVMVPFFTGDYFNPSSMYEPARHTAHAVADARETIASFIGADAKEILFTSCATESNNMAILGTAKANPERRHVITTGVEHPAVWEVCRQLEREGYEVTFLPVDHDGRLDAGQFIRALRGDTLLVTVMHGNNETGGIFPIEQLARLTKETDPSIVFHTDATQTVGKLPIDLKGLLRNVDLLSFSGHKLHAPKGIGALFIRRGTPCRPLLIGGHQESGRRGGTENVPYIVGLAKAVQLAAENLDDEETRIRHLRDKLEQGIQDRIPCTQVNGEQAPRLPNTSNISCHYVEGEGMLYQLSEFGICASSGSACTSGSLEPSHVLQALHVPFTAIHGSIRFSFSRYNTNEDVDRILEVFPQVVANLRRMSPYWDNRTNAPREDAESLLKQNT